MISLEDVVIEPHVCYGHSILGQGTSLVGTDDRAGTQRLYAFEALHETVLTSHALSSKCQYHLSIKIIKKQSEKSIGQAACQD